jgi:hypothetical protein
MVHFACKSRKNAEAISKIPLASFRVFFLHPSLLSLPIHQRYELRKAPARLNRRSGGPRLDEKSCKNRLIPIFEMTSNQMSPGFLIRWFAASAETIDSPDVTGEENPYNFVKRII